MDWEAVARAFGVEHALIGQSGDVFDHQHGCGLFFIVAQVRLFPDAGPVVVDDKLIEDAFPYSTWQQVINEPFTVTNTQGRFRVVAKVKGGGVNGRAGAIRHGIARALSQVENGRYRLDLKKAGLLTRDSRVKERKKPGLKRARKAKQYTKR